MNVEEVKERLEELEERYQEWTAPINRITQECWHKVNRDGYTAADFDRDVKRARDERLAQYDPFKDMSEFQKVFDPGHPQADEHGYLTLPNVNLPVEMINLTLATRSYQTNVAVLKRYQSMVETTLELLR